MRASGVSDKGSVRPINEDCFAVREDLGVCIVADGMGGHNAGEVASRIVVDAVLEHLAGAEGRDFAERHPFGVDGTLSEQGNLLRSAILVANVRILEASAATDRYAGMGTTVVAATVSDGHLAVGHAGDSRLYVLADGTLRPLTSDDSWMATILAREPNADPAMLRQHPMRHALTNVVGGRARPDVHVSEETLRGGELLLLATDGVHSVVDDPRLERLMTRGGDLRKIAERIVETALALGTRDNATAVVAMYTAAQALG